MSIRRIVSPVKQIFEIRDSKLLSMFRKKPISLQTASPYIPLTTTKSQKRMYRNKPKQKWTSRYPLSRIPLGYLANKVTTQIPPGPIFAFPRPG